MVFLGAGASIPLGFPGSIKLVDDFVAELRRSHEPDKITMLDKIRKIKKIIISNKFDYDSESLYSCLQGYASPVRYIRQTGPFVSSLCKTQPISKIKLDPVCVKLRSLFEEFLITKYYKEDPFLKLRIKAVYNRFFSKISGIADWKSSEPNWASSSFEIFTTNFDYVLETYSDQVNQGRFTGYRIVENNRVIFTPHEYEKSRAPLKIYKLHGSVDLSALDNNTIISTLPPAIPGKTYGGKRIVSKVMVYGIQKNVIAEPYFDLLALFKKRLAKIKDCLVVGYSFRDPWINQLFLDVIKNYPNMIKIRFIGVKERTTLPKIPILNRAVVSISRRFEGFLELPVTEGEGN